VLSRNPRAHAPWETEGTIDDVVAIARAAEAAGYDFLTCSEHVAVPRVAVATRGGTYWDPLATLGYLAAVTERIHLVPYVLVLGYHHPLALAKRYGTLDRLSAGRVILGVGVGSLEEEFNLLGAPFEDRGERADDALRALHAAWGREESTYDGTHVRFRDMVVDPTALRTSVAIWVGGRTRRSLRRAVELASGWAPFGLEGAEIRAALDRVDKPADFEVILQPVPPVDPIGDPDGTRRGFEALRAAGATAIALRVRSNSLTHYCDQLEAAAALSD